MERPEANAALLESWELHLRSPLDGGRPKRPRTIAFYLEEMHRFIRWLTSSGHDGDLEHVARDHAAAWINDMRTRGLADATVRSRWIVLRNFYGWATAEEILTENPVAAILVAKAQEPPPDVLSDATIKALLAACRGTSFNDRRDLALIRFMLATGLRVSEACEVTLTGVDLLARLVTIEGKGGKIRVARFDPATASAVDRYRRIRGKHRLASRPDLWLGYRGPLTRKGAAAILDRRSEMAGVGHVHAHQLRHTYAHRMKLAGVSDENLMALAGWADPVSLRRYGAHLGVERALASYDTADPMGGL